MRWIGRLTSATASESSQTIPTKSSTDLVHAEVVRSVVAQNENAKTLDAKVGWLLTAGSLIAGLSDFGGGALLSVDDSRYWLLPGLVAYLWLVWCFYQSAKLRVYTSTALDPSILREYANCDHEEVALMCIDSLATAHKQNVVTVEDKTRWVERMEKALLIQASALLAFSIIGAEWGRIERAICSVCS